jgi:hypothetical protein
MTNWIEQNHNDINLFDLKYSPSLKDFDLMTSDLVELIGGHQIGEYKNFKVLK